MRGDHQRLLNQSGFAAYHEELLGSAGVKIVLSVYPARDPRDPWLVFLPGTMSHPLAYDDFLTAYARLGCNAVGVHFIHHGKSPRTRPRFVFSDLVANARDAIDWCFAQGARSVAVSGSSQGGIVALAVAAREERLCAAIPHNIVLPERPESIEVTRFPRFLKPFVGAMRFAFRAGAALAPEVRLPPSLYVNPEGAFPSEASRRRFFEDPLRPQGYPLCFISSLFDAQVVPEGSEVRPPLYLLVASGDPVFPCEQQLRTFELVRARRKEVVMIDEPHHLIFQVVPEKLARIVADIVERESTPPRG